MLLFPSSGTRRDHDAIQSGLIKVIDPPAEERRPILINIQKGLQMKSWTLGLNKHIPASVSGELVQNIDLLPSMLYFSGIDIPPDLDGILPKEFGGGKERTAVITEDLYTNRQYRASVKNKDFDLQFVSEHPKM